MLNTYLTYKSEREHEFPVFILKVDEFDGKPLSDKNRKLFTYVVYKQMIITEKSGETVWSGNYVFRPLENNNTIVPTLYVTNSALNPNKDHKTHTIISFMPQSNKATMTSLNAANITDIDSHIIEIAEVNSRLDGISFPMLRELLLLSIKWIKYESIKEVK